MMPATYLDCNATTPVDPSVRDTVLQFLEEDFGNAGSRTHEYGNRAMQAVQRARDAIARAVGANRDEVVFTSGATESSNLGVLGLAETLAQVRRRHVVVSAIEHKAVLEPVQLLQERGFEVTVVRPTQRGRVAADAFIDAIKDNTGLVCLMHVNNETGVVQPIASVADRLSGHPAYFLVDGAQGLGKRTSDLRHPRIDLVTLSGHKCFAPKGIGALVMRRRGFERPPLKPLMAGGGQERGLRPGTLPVHLIAGFGEAVNLALNREEAWRAHNAQLKTKLLLSIQDLNPCIHGDPEHTLPTTLNFSIPGIDSEAAIVALKGLVAISNGSACTSHKYEPSHVLEAMGLTQEQVAGALRFSWCHLTPEPDFDEIARRLGALK